MIIISSIYQKFLKTSLELYGWQFDMEEIPALFDNCYLVVELLNNFIRTQLTVKSRDCNIFFGFFGNKNVLVQLLLICMLLKAVT